VQEEEEKWVQNEHLIDNTTEELVIKLQFSGKSGRNEITLWKELSFPPLSYEGD
jgi:hypothetical protein